MLRAVLLRVGHPSPDRPCKHIGIEISRDVEIAGQAEVYLFEFDGGAVKPCRRTKPHWNFAID